MPHDALPGIPPGRDQMRIGILTHLSVDTVRRIYRTGRGAPHTIMAVARAARELGLEPPLAAEPLEREARRG